jgi:3-(3-hydroxy-phenyl)propionate hydroxylase
MAEANRYTLSSICQTEGGLMAQNVALQFTAHHVGCLGDLLLWADSGLLLLVFGACSTQELHQLRQLSQSAAVRIVQVVSHEAAQAVEHVIDKPQRLRQACGDATARWALLRPDAYVAARGQALNAGLVHSVAKALAIP